MAAPAKEKTVKVKANYSFCDVPEGKEQMLWGIAFEHITKEQDGEAFHFLVADLPADIAKEMNAAGRVSKFA